MVVRRLRQVLRLLAAPPRPQSSYKPATLIESPIEWDGSGLLPGESSRGIAIAPPGRSPRRSLWRKPVRSLLPKFMPSRGVFVDSPNAFFEEIRRAKNSSSTPPLKTPLKRLRRTEQSSISLKKKFRTTC